MDEQPGRQSQSQSGRTSNQGGVQRGRTSKNRFAVRRLSAVLTGLLDRTGLKTGWAGRWILGGEVVSWDLLALMTDGGVPFGEGLFGQVPCLSLPGEVCLCLGVGQEKKR